MSSFTATIGYHGRKSLEIVEMLSRTVPLNKTKPTQAVYGCLNNGFLNYHTIVPQVLTMFSFYIFRAVFA